MNNSRLISTIVLIVIVGFTFQECNRPQGAKTAAEPDMTQPQVMNGGTEIKFAPRSLQLQQFTIDTIRKTFMSLSISAPAHNLLSVVKSELGEGKLYLFETQDITDLWSSYVTSVANLEHSTLALKRTQDLFDHDIAAASDLQDAKQDYATQQSALADNVGHLRAGGIDPTELSATPAGTIWTVAEVPEAQIGLIKINGSATVEFNSYPGREFTARISAISAVIDPAVRTVRVRLILPNPVGELRPSMYGTAHFIMSRQEVVTVPTTGVVREGDNTMTAWVTSDGFDFLHRTVRLGMEKDGSYQVIDGLQPGELVVTRGGVFISNMVDAPSAD
ncbi:MAG: efflux RND transporter periplasmic adaptor subunit [Chitinispirillaceae bacterium]|jgi:membrane fusion protein, heavy metal efflux system